MIKRIFDLVLIVTLGIPILIVAAFIKVVSKGLAIFWINRVGINNGIFKMKKFRTMKLNIPQEAIHLMEDPQKYLIKGGEFLWICSLDELPQLFNVLKGDMTFVGPRPALFNQDGLAGLY
jgi:O-antigen biosynthesis protein WbqP